ncbi:hypothetical protein IWQ60_004851 [Tieghemiomyces parasiticus]|uniref:Late embryogenesis abundant protein LEA-2 subgroup domain-containing protein n=1 Tax=Tieghemiomyces parasiticus TaxID=78921 RepID=A0A9W8A824_9FUNG|nr:hypothetical protein IWQ60_004851 [Tieghemiomyces parasiticus]
MSRYIDADRRRDPLNDGASYRSAGNSNPYGHDPFATPTTQSTAAFDPHRQTQYTEANSVLDYYHGQPDMDLGSPEAERRYLNRAPAPGVDTAAPYHPGSPHDVHAPLQPSAATLAEDDYAFKREPTLAYPAPQEPALRPRRSAFRRYCCCCCRSRKSTFICLTILVIILAGVGVTLYFVWPRIPTVEVTGVSLTSQSPRLSTTQLATRRAILPDDSPVGLMHPIRRDVTTGASVPIYFSIKAYNPNYIPWTLSNVTVTGTLPVTVDGSTVDYPLGQGALDAGVTFPKMANTTFELPYQLSLDPSANGFSQAAQQFISKCATSSDIRISYRAVVEVRGISWLGIKPTISDSTNFNCPADTVLKLGLNALLGQ